MRVNLDSGLISRNRISIIFGGIMILQSHSDRFQKSLQADFQRRSAFNDQLYFIREITCWIAGSTNQPMVFKIHIPHCTASMRYVVFISNNLRQLRLFGLFSSLPPKAAKNLKKPGGADTPEPS
jgi:hypothetical protein